MIIENMFYNKLSMYFYAFLLFSVLFSSFISCGRIRRIVNGDVVEPGRFPIAVSLRAVAQSTHMCGGTLISQDYVVTAAHCIQQSYGEHNVEKYFIRLQNLVSEDATNNNTIENRGLENIDIGVQKIYIHNEYNVRTSFHDIAMIRLNKSVTLLDHFFVNLLPESSFGLTGDCEVFGYGKTSFFTNDTSYDILRVGQVSIISALECEESLTEYIAPKPGSGMICATGVHSDACLGDSGSPMICNGVFEGVVSYGMGCRTSPGVYTRVALHMDWIYSILLE